MVTYESMRTADPSARTLWPHALVFSGYRWFVRAFDSKHGRFGDFVLSRLTRVKTATKSRPLEASPAADREWQDHLIVEVVPAPQLSDAQAAVVAREYGMRRRAGQWSWQPSVRRSMVPYFILFHRLDAAGVERIALTDRLLLTQFAFAEN